MGERPLITTTTNHDHEMNPTPFSVIKQHLADGAVLECIEGKITKLFPRKSGTGEHGEWSFQNGEMSDAAGDLIEIKWKGCEDVPGSWKGKTVRVYSHKGEKGRTGLYAFDDEYQGKTTRKVKIISTAEMVNAADARGGEGLAAAVDEKLDQRQRAADAAPQQSAPRQEAPARQETGSAAPPDFLLNVKKRAARLAAMHGICVDAAVHSAHGVLQRHGYAMVPQAVLILADKIFMETVRRSEPDLMPMNAYKEGYNGPTLKELVEELNKQVADHRATLNPPPATLNPPPAKSAFFDEEPGADSVPF